MKGLLTWLATQKSAALVAALVAALTSVLAPALGLSPQGVEACVEVVKALLGP